MRTERAIRTCRIAVTMLLWLPMWSDLYAQAAPVVGSSATNVPERAFVLARAQQRATTGDTAGAVELLRGAATDAPNDAVLWHAYGSLLSAWTKRYWRTGAMPTGVPQKLAAAETSLARASRLAPNSARYALDYGNHLWGASAFTITRAQVTQRDALDRAERVGDSASIGAMSDLIGGLLWARYEPLINQRFEVQNFGYSFSDYVSEPWKFRMYVDEGLRSWDPPVGESLYEESVRHFRRASEVLLDDEAAFRHHAMALAERARWDEIASSARTRIRQRPSQMWPWLALGLSELRLQHGQSASAALDSGFARMRRSDRERLLTLKRLLPTRAAKMFDTLSGPAKAQLEGVYWNVANPSMLLPGNPVLDEFRARVVHAGLMWSNDVTGSHGADTDRGEIMIRWGPPDQITNHLRAPPTLERDMMSWMYRRIGLNFFFNQPPIGAPSLQQFSRTNMLEPNQFKRPALWDNVPSLRRGVDSVAVQVARFRSTRDSIDVAVYVGIRDGALRAGFPGDTTILRAGVFAINAAGDVQTRLTDEIRTGQRDTMALTSRAWRTRIPASAAYLRVEALETDAVRVARVIREVGAFATSGFGISDVLFGTQITPPANATSARWREYTVAPIAGNVIYTGQAIDLLWEVYEPMVSSGASRYRVSIGLQRAERSGLVGVTARLAGGLRDAIMRSGSGGRVSVEFDRTVPGGAVHAEHLRLDLGSAGAGKYLLTVTVRDLNANRTTTRQRDVVLVDK